MEKITKPQLYWSVVSFIIAAVFLLMEVVFVNGFSTVMNSFLRGYDNDQVRANLFNISWFIISFLIMILGFLRLGMRMLKINHKYFETPSAKYGTLKLAASIFFMFLAFLFILPIIMNFVSFTTFRISFGNVATWLAATELATLFSVTIILFWLSVSLRKSALKKRPEIELLGEIV